MSYIPQPPPAQQQQGGTAAASPQQPSSSSPPKQQQQQRVPSAKPKIPPMAPPFKYNSGRVPQATEDEDPLAVDISEQLQYEKELFMAGKGLGHTAHSLASDTPRRPTLVKTAGEADATAVVGALLTAAGGSNTSPSRNSIAAAASSGTSPAAGGGGGGLSPNHPHPPPQTMLEEISGTTGLGGLSYSQQRRIKALGVPSAILESTVARSAEAYAIQRRGGTDPSPYDVSPTRANNNNTNSGGQSPMMRPPSSPSRSPQRSPRYHMGTDTSTYHALHHYSPARNSVVAISNNGDGEASPSANGAVVALPAIAGASSVAKKDDDGESPRGGGVKSVYGARLAAVSHRSMTGGCNTTSNGYGLSGQGEGAGDLRALIAAQQIDEDPYSIRKQLKAITPLRAIATIMHNIPLIVAEEEGGGGQQRHDDKRQLLGLRLLCKIGSERDPAVVWRKVTAVELTVLKRKERDEEEDRQRRAQMLSMLDAQRPKQSERDVFMAQYAQSQLQARLQASSEADRLAALDRRIAAQEKVLGKEKVMRDREPTQPIVHKIFDEGRQLQQFAAAKRASVIQSAQHNTAADMSASQQQQQQMHRSGVGAAQHQQHQQQMSPPQLTRLPPLNDAEVQAKKARHHAEMEARIARLKEASEALAKKDEEARAQMEAVEKAKKEWEVEKRKLVGLEPNPPAAGGNANAAVTAVQ